MLLQKTLRLARSIPLASGLALRKVQTSSTNSTNSQRFPWIRTALSTVALGGALSFFGLSSAVADGELKDDSSKKKAEFRSRVFANYNDRIRKFSSPEKVFRTFASKSHDGEPVMTTRDFLESLYPSIQKDSGADVTGPLDKFLKLEGTPDEVRISFSEYILFATLLSIPHRQIQIAFKLFDSNMNGEVDKTEFVRLVSALGKQSSFGNSQRVLTGSIVADNSPLVKHLFGENGEKILKLEDFEGFVKDLQMALLQCEYYSFPRDHDNTISVHDFALSIIAFSNPHRSSEFIQRAAKLEERQERVSFRDFINFHRFIEYSSDIRLGIRLLASSQGCKEHELRRLIRSITGTDLSKTQIDVLFMIYDHDGDGYIAESELLALVDYRTTFGFGGQRSTGFVEFINCLRNCGSQL